MDVKMGKRIARKEKKIISNARKKGWKEGKNSK